MPLESHELTGLALSAIALKLPGATAVLHRYRLDFCCRGQQSLAEACEQRHQNLETVLNDLYPLLAQGAHGTDWTQHSTRELTQHILHTYHEQHRQQLPEMIRLARRVERVHVQNPSCPHGLTDFLDQMMQELESHMIKEEQVLFPMLNHRPGNRPEGPIAVMMSEHVQHGEALQRIRELTHDLQAPDDACTTWRALYHELRYLEEQLMEHIHLENHVLFAGLTQE